MLDVAETIGRFNAGRDPERLAMKYTNMRASPFVFLRGACHLFYERLTDCATLPDSPLAWVCGDLHLENFGSYKADNRLVYFDLSDFDESALAPATWDLVRLLTSVHTAAQTLRVDPAQAKSLCRDFIGGYCEALESGKARWLERETAQGLIKQLLDKLRDRERADLLNERTQLKGRRRTIRCDGKHALVADRKDHARARELIEACPTTRDDRRFYEVLDVARRIAGTGSLGVERYVALVHGKGSPDRNYLLDVKRALPSSLERHLRIPQPSWPSQAHRIVAIQTRVQAISPAFLHPVARRRKSYVIRALQPSEDRMSLDASHVSLVKLRLVLADMGRLVAWGQLRSSGRQRSAVADELIEFGATRRNWEGALMEAARACAKQTVRDWKSYSQAYDAGVFASR